MNNEKLNPLVIINFATSGIDEIGQVHSSKCAVTQIAALAIKGDTLERIVTYDNLIQPYSTDLEYQSQAAMLTDINRERCINEGVSIEQAVADLRALFDEANIQNSEKHKPIIVAHNLPFVRQFLVDIWKRAAGVSYHLYDYIDCDFDYKRNIVPNGIDTLELAKYAFPLSKSYALQAICNEAGAVGDAIFPRNPSLNNIELIYSLLKKLFYKLRKP